MIISFLELTDPAALRAPSRAPRLDCEIRAIHDPAVNRGLYQEIGADFNWIERSGWSDAQWRVWAGDVETWVADVGSEHAGYAELQPKGDAVLLAIFGLLEPYRGAGLGGALLTHALRRGFELGDRVWVSTNTDDGPHALANYLARGMTVFRTEER